MFTNKLDTIALHSTGKAYVNVLVEVCTSTLMSVRVEWTTQVNLPVVGSYLRSVMDEDFSERREVVVIFYHRILPLLIN